MYLQYQSAWELGQEETDILLPSTFLQKALFNGNKNRVKSVKKCKFKAKQGYLGSKIPLKFLSNVSYVKFYLK